MCQLYKTKSKVFSIMVPPTIKLIPKGNITRLIGLCELISEIEQMNPSNVYLKILFIGNLRIFTSEIVEH